MSDNNTKDTKNLKNAYFVTLDNISTYDNGDTLTMEDAIAKIQLNWNLASKEKSLEKETMLLNNCIITINQIQERLPEEYVVPAYVAILECLLKQNLVSEAMEYLTDVCSFLEEESDEIKTKYAAKIFDIEITLQNLAYCSNQIEEFFKLFHNINNSYKYCEKNSKQMHNFAGANALIGKILFEAQMLDEAYQFIKTTNDILKELYEKNECSPFEFAGSSFTYANLFYQSGNYGQAITRFKELIDFCERNEFNNKQNILSMTYNYLGQVYVCLNDYEEAINTYKKIDEIVSKYEENDKLIDERADYRYRIGLIYYKFLKNNQEAKKYFEEALAFLQRTVNPTNETSDFIEVLESYINNL